MPLIVPPPLRPGDTVAAVSLSSGLAAAIPHRYAQGKQQFEETFGVRVVEAPRALADDAWLRHHPEARAADLHWALQHPDVRGIVSTIGGDDAVRVVPHLDRALIRAHPKPFLGFSDTTAVLLAFHAAGVVSYHGPSLMTDLAETGGIRPEVRASVLSALFSEAPYIIVPSAQWSEARADWGDPVARAQPRTFVPNAGWTWLQGWGGPTAPARVAGRLLGGCAEVLEMCKGTGVWPSVDAWNGAVLLLETSELVPSPLWVGYWLQNYGAQGILQRLTGLLLGRPYSYTAAQHADLHTTVRTVLAEWGRADLPVLADVDLGHTSPQLVLPIGARVVIDCHRECIEVTRRGGDPNV
jgi:muramoyltetrapeptide carboxypeptidase LdcA involved in peptidoglycan recycling